MKKLLVDEDTFVDLVAQVEVHKHMIEMLMAYQLREFPADQRGPWLDDFQKKFLGPVKLPNVRTEGQAVFLSDVTVQMRERASELIDRLRVHVTADLEWERQQGEHANGS